MHPLVKVEHKARLFTHVVPSTLCALYPRVFIISTLCIAKASGPLHRKPPLKQVGLQTQMQFAQAANMNPLVFDMNADLGLAAMQQMRTRQQQQVRWPERQSITCSAKCDWLSAKSMEESAARLPVACCISPSG